jgi:hypothetical protein
MKNSRKIYNALINKHIFIGFPIYSFWGYPCHAYLFSVETPNAL